MRWCMHGNITQANHQGKATMTRSGLPKCGRSGFFPTATGEPGGKETGQRMTHLINENGRFAKVATILLRDHPAILYHDRSSENDVSRKKKTASKTKYTCPVCGLNAWAKPEAPLVCGSCEAVMEAEIT